MGVFGDRSGDRRIPPSLDVGGDDGEGERGTDRGRPTDDIR